MFRRADILTKKRILIVMSFFLLTSTLLHSRLLYIQCCDAEKYQKIAYEQQTRDRLISAKRGDISDRNFMPLATTQTVASISVIHAQIKDEEKVAVELSKRLNLNYDDVLKKVKKRVALVRIKTKVDKEKADEIRHLNLEGVVVDEDIKRIYPYKTLASQVIGFVGKDNQGIIGLEAKYDEILKGKQGKLLTQTDVRGRENNESSQERIPPKNGLTLVTTIDLKMQQFAEQTIEKTIQYKQAKRGAIIIMNPQNGEIYALASKPDFDLNEPFKINNTELKANWDILSEKDKNNALNQMWRNFSINECVIIVNTKFYIRDL